MRMVHQIMKLEHVLRSSYRVSGQHSTHEEHEAHDERDHDADGEHEEAGADVAHVAVEEHLDADQRVRQHVLAARLRVRLRLLHRLRQAGRRRRVDVVGVFGVFGALGHHAARGHLGVGADHRHAAVPTSDGEEGGGHDARRVQRHGPAVGAERVVRETVARVRALNHVLEGRDGVGILASTARERSTE